MSSSFRLAPGVTWADRPQCPFQLIGHCKGTWYITDNGLRDVKAITSFRAPGFGVAWAQHGVELYLSDADYKLKRIVFEMATSAQPTRVDELTPHEWETKEVALVDGCLDADMSALYLLVRHNREKEVSVWRASTHHGNRNVELVCDRLPFASVHLSSTQHGPILIRRNHPQHGVVRLTNLRTGCECDCELSPSEPIAHLSLSYSGTKCLFSTGIQAAEAKLWSRQLATGEVQFLTHAAYGSLSPDGCTIAALRADQELLLLREDTNGIRTIISSQPMHDEDQLPWLAPLPLQWSPDGEWLAFCLFRWLERPTQATYLKLVEPATFVLAVSQCSIVRLPFFCQGCRWRPKEPFTEEERESQRGQSQFSS